MLNLAGIIGFVDDIWFCEGPISQLTPSRGAPVTPVAHTLTSKLFSSYHLWEMLYTK